MDKETLWILKKLSKREISVESAERILRALRLLSESDERTEKQNVTVETPQETQETNPAAGEQEAVDIEEIPEVPQETEETPPDTVLSEPADEIQLLGDDGIAVIEDIPDGAELVLGKAGNITIQGWDESYLRVEGEENSSAIRMVGNLLTVRCDSDIILYIPLSISKISFVAGLGLADIENCPDDMVIDGDNRDISVRYARGNVEVSSNEGNISFEGCHADINVSSGKGNVSVFDGEFSLDAMGSIDVKIETGNAYIHRGSVQNINVEIENGNVELDMEKLSSDGAGRINVNKGNITVKVPPDFECELIARGSRKNMYIELPVEVMGKDKNLLRGTLNGGGAKLEALASDGEIRLQTMELPDEQRSMASVVSNSEISQSNG